MSCVVDLLQSADTLSMVRQISRVFRCFGDVYGGQQENKQRKIKACDYIFLSFLFSILVLIKYFTFSSHV